MFVLFYLYFVVFEECFLRNRVVELWDIEYFDGGRLVLCLLVYSFFWNIVGIFYFVFGYKDGDGVVLGFRCKGEVGNVFDMEFVLYFD